jgi:hypothetical protein
MKKRRGRDHQNSINAPLFDPPLIGVCDNLNLEYHAATILQGISKVFIIHIWCGHCNE